MESGRDMEVHANNPGKVSRGHETKVRTFCRLPGEPRISLRSGRCVRTVCCQRGEVVGMGRGGRAIDA